jgi:hypothetical protein
MGYLIGDSSAGKVYRYGYNATTKQFDEDTGSSTYLNTQDSPVASFGTAIAYSKNLFVRYSNCLL